MGQKDRRHESDPYVAVLPAEFLSRLPEAAKPQSIFKGDVVEIGPRHIFTDPFEAIVGYVLTRHREEFEDVRDQCPYNTNLATPELVLKQQLTWFACARPRPATGITVVEEFVRNNDLPRDFAEEFLQLTKLFLDNFRVIGRSGSYVKVYGTRTRRKYTVLSHNSSGYPIGCMFEGCIHPYGDKYKFCGITSAVQT